MKQAFLALAFVLVGMVPSARAGCPTCCCPPCVTWVPCAVTCYRPEVRTRDVQYTVMKVVPRQEVVQKKCLVMVPQWHDEVRTCTVPVMQPRTLTREKVIMGSVPVTVQDPCTGCCYTVCKPVATLQQYTTSFMVPVPTQQNYTVKVCTMVPVERTYQEARTVCDTVAVPMVRKECYTVLTPYTVTTQMPVVH